MLRVAGSSSSFCLAFRCCPHFARPTSLIAIPKDKFCSQRPRQIHFFGSKGGSCWNDSGIAAEEQDRGSRRRSVGSIRRLLILIKAKREGVRKIVLEEIEHPVEKPRRDSSSTSGSIKYCKVISGFIEDPRSRKNQLKLMG